MTTIDEKHSSAENSVVGREVQPKQTGYFHLVLTWVRDAAAFARYSEQAAPIVERYGGAVARILVPDAIYAEGMEKPEFVNVLRYASRSAYEALLADPEFTGLASLRAQAITMASVAGLNEGGGAGVVAGGNVEGRKYLVEIARFGPKGSDGYRHCEVESEAVMKRYGYHVESRLPADSSSGFPFVPDVAKVAYFDTMDGMDKMHTDPAHHHIENELYPGAVAQSVWLIAKARARAVGAEDEAFGIAFG